MLNNIGRKVHLTIEGAEYTLSRWTVEIECQFLDWVKPRLPDPLDILEKMLPKIKERELAEQLIKQVYEDAKRYLTITSPDVLEVVNSTEGLCKIFYLLLKKNHPNITEEQSNYLCSQYVAENGAQQLQEELSKTSGQMPPSEEKKTDHITPLTGGK